MKKLIKIIGLAIIDFGLIWLWVYDMDPDPSVSIFIFILIPFVFLINLIIAGILFYFKKKNASKLFLINSIIASILVLLLFNKGIDRHQNNRLESWEFEIADTTFQLTRWKKIDEFSMSYQLNPGSSTSFLDGECINNDGKWILKVDSTEMRIIENKLIGFREPTDTIKMKYLER